MKIFKNVNKDGNIVDILVKDKEIDKIKKNIQCFGAEEIECHGKKIIPSFANAHSHAAMTLLRGYADDMELFKWLNDYIWVLEAKLTPEDVYWGTRLACLEMIKTGTTCFNDMYWMTDASAKAVEDSGLRANLSFCFLDRNDKDYAKTQMEAMEEFFSKNKDTERVKFTCGPHAIYTVREDSFKWLANYCDTNDKMIHIHVSETKKEVDDCLLKTKMTPVEYLYNLGMINENSILAHCVWLTENDCKILKKSGATIAHNPASNLKLSSGFINNKMIKEHGIRLAISTDGCSSNNNLSMFDEMKFAALLPKYIEMNPEIYTAKDVFKDATLSGFEAMHINGGEITEGKLADFVLLKNNAYQLTPGFNLYSDLVYSADSSVVDTVVCNGQIVNNSGLVKDEELIITKVQECVKNLLHRAGK